MRSALRDLKDESFYKTIAIEKLENQLRESEKTLGLQFTIVSALTSSFNLSDTAARVLRTMGHAMSLNEVAILLYEEDDRKLHHFSSFGLSKEKHKATFSPGEGISGIAFHDRKSCLVERAGEDPRFKHWGVVTTEYAKKAFLSIPLMDSERVIGVINACADVIPPHYQKTLESLAALMTPIISLQRTKGAEEKNFYETIKRVMDFTEALSPYTSGHCLRVSRYAGMIAQEMRFHGHDIDIIERGARVHDIGKIAMMDIVKKRGKLTGRQKKIMRTHPLIGEQFVKGFDFLKDAIPIIKYHHERYDGRGYPGKLKGNRIPASARIVTVAEVFDAMTTKRSYRGQHSFTYAVSQLKRHSGRQFDPSVIRTFLRDINFLRKFTDQTKDEAALFLREMTY